ncbi:hypothetical protein FRB99_001315, partial [Tulasnella sp. 403]
MPFGTVVLNDGRQIPEIAFGTGSVWKGKDAEPYVVKAINAGFSHVDCAQAYGNEESVGLALKDTAIARDDIWITTKYFENLGEKPLGVRGKLLGSLQKLGLEYVDLYLIHNPIRVPFDIPTTWKAFEEVLKEGLTKSIGVSNFTVPQLELLMKHAKITPAVNQINFNPYKLAEMEPVLNYCRKHGVVVEAYSPLTPITRQPGGPVDEPVRKAAERLNATPGQILLAWARTKGVVIVTTSSKSSRLQEYMDAGDLPPLLPEEIAAIDAAGRAGFPQHLR